jgi:iron complex outermembrane receptor protein
MKMKLFTSVAFAALLIPSAAFAQSTGTQEFDKDIVVTGAKKDLAGATIPDSPKTKAELSNAFLSHEVAGQSVLESINNLPGVSFTNNDPYGSSGGTLTIRGFDASRISLTIDGVPLNDTGNYAVYSNQQLDPELIEQVNVILGSTDIDSPSASATGSTVNYTTVNPTDKFGARVSGSIGDLDMLRIFGQLNTGVFTPFGTKAWFAASNQTYDTVFHSAGKIDKSQYNFKVYQPIGSNGDFIAVAGNYNVNRNNNTPDFYIDSVPRTKSARNYTVAPCTINQTAVTGKVDSVNSCGTDYTASFNPSNTGTLRVSSRFHLAPNLVLSVDPTFWYTKANGGSSAVTVNEGLSPNGLRGFVANSTAVSAGTGAYYAGQDLNGDGDTLDTAKYYAPSQTTTHRILVLSSLLWTPSDTQSLRLAYSYDHGLHRQTGELAPLSLNGASSAYFPSDDPFVLNNGVTFEKRNRKSYAILNEVGGEYRGKFFNDRLTLNAGFSAKFFERDLNNYCFTTTAAGGVNCVAGDATAQAAYAAAHPYTYNATTGVVTGYATPQSRNFHYNRVLPSAGFTYKFDNGFQLYGSFSEGIQVPGTDNLYGSFYQPVGVQSPKPEISYNFDAGLRYRSNKIQAQVGPWYTIFDNRLASNYDPIADVTTYTNLGTVHRYGVDGSITYSPVRQLSLYAFGSYLKSKILDNVPSGVCTTAQITAAASNNNGGTCTATNNTFYALTAGKRESGAPVYTVGGRAQVNINPVTIGGEIKRTGRSYLNDQNLALVYNGVNYGKVTPGYTVVNLDARLNMGWAGLNNTTYFQFNVTNLFDTLYITHAGSGLSATNDPFVYISPPRTVSGTLNIQF